MLAAWTRRLQQRRKQRRQSEVIRAIMLEDSLCSLHGPDACSSAASNRPGASRRQQQLQQAIRAI